LDWNSEAHSGSVHASRHGRELGGGAAQWRKLEFLASVPASFKNSRVVNGNACILHVPWWGRIGAVTLVHDMKLALRFATRVICISDDASASNGPPESCLTPGLLEHAFDIPMTKFRSISGAQLVASS
jgi:hypothetical protein